MLQHLIVNGVYSLSSIFWNALSYTSYFEMKNDFSSAVFSKKSSIGIEELKELTAE